MEDFKHFIIFRFNAVDDSFLEDDDIEDNFFVYMLKVDGLIRLMEGEHTGPINIGNPGYMISDFLTRNYMIVWFCWFCYHY